MNTQFPAFLTSCLSLALVSVAGVHVSAADAPKSSGTASRADSAFSVAAPLSVPTSAHSRNDTASGTVPSGSNLDDFARFASIARHNIFDPSRFDYSSYSGAGQNGPAYKSVTLVGTLLHENGKFAFFDGSDEQDRRVLAPGAKFHGFTLSQILPNEIELTRANNEVFTLKMTQQLRSLDGTEWTVSDPPLEASTPVLAPNDARPQPIVPPNASDTLLRLMNQRKKQLSSP